MDLRRGLARSLRLIRKVKGIPQDQLSEVSGRTYLSEIERGIKNPTLAKIDALAKAMNVHPLTLLTITYLASLREQDVDGLQDRVRKEALGLLEKAEITKPQKARSR
ncbi:MAG: helix-turn-helix transcriptional regulator [Proteobacteria bacterium]|nr:helix-turn-helix transcriptional regulator [Pseudomonadota bacterium]